MRRAVSWVVNSRSSRNSRALRIPDLNCVIAAAKICAPSRCKYLASESGFVSGTSRPGAVPSLLESSMCTSRSARPLRSNIRSEEHTSELQSHSDLVCRLLLEKKKEKHDTSIVPE